MFEQVDHVKSFEAWGWTSCHPSHLWVVDQKAKKSSASVSAIGIRLQNLEELVKNQPRHVEDVRSPNSLGLQTVRKFSASKKKLEVCYTSTYFLLTL